MDKLDEIYEVGTFAQIMEMQDLGTRLRMVVQGHRRISLIGPANDVEEETEEAAVKGKDASNKPKSEDTPAAATETPPIASPEHILIMETENFEHDDFEVTDEMKAITQEVIKTIRDIIVRTLKCSSASSSKDFVSI